ncbi:Arylsulfatase [bacterium HR17]|uniref:Arylsulfatase n=1 Tax=Candidatus Fervidibacter japonicus TaxID=2035412 RepID=A0A2H5X9V0_9BACT|nr:Arylsulfatase [bacterium HR17]
MSRRPNLLFIFADQMRGMDMGCVGNKDVITPNLDRLAEEGTLFIRAYANVPVCTPSRAMLLTGKYPFKTRVVANDLPLPENERTIGEILRDAGYRTGYIGKWHLDGVPRDRFTPPGPRRHGFEFWAAWNCAHDYFNGRIYRDTPEPISLPGYEPVAQTDIALEFLSQQDERPFALFLSFGPPHDPYWQVPENYQRLYDPERLTLRPNVKEPISPRVPLHPKDREMRRAIANYYAHITALDEQVGRLLRALDEIKSLNETKLSENTIVVFTSDHGDMLWSQGMLKKQQPYEESINIPLIVRWPGRIPKGRVSEQLVGIVDLAPTLLALMGLLVPEDMDGTDLSAHFLGERASENASVFLMDLVTADEAFVQGLREWRGIRTARYTYARFVDGEEWLLYDNLNDPYQLRNLVHDPSFASVKASLEAELRRSMQRVGDEGLSWRELIKRLDLVELWNEREKALNPSNPRTIENE